MGDGLVLRHPIDQVPSDYGFTLRAYEHPIPANVIFRQSRLGPERQAGAFDFDARSDVVRLGLPHMHEGFLTWLPHKGRNKEDAVEVSIPVLPELRSVIDATPVVGTTTFLVTDYGRPFTANGFGNKMGDWCKRAGLSGLNSHGVRKAAATRMADRGANAHALMATFGWLDIKQAELYTRQAERKRLATENAHLLGTNSDGIFPTIGSRDQAVGKKRGKK